MFQSYYSHGKILLTGEYLVLDGAEALALPTKLGQRLQTTLLHSLHDTNQKLLWKSFTHLNEVWFEAEYEIPSFNITSSTNTEIAHRLKQILQEAAKLNSEFLFDTHNSLKITTHLEFNREWGLGSSSTLINNIALWAKADPYLLLKKTLGGSGYDVAAANADSAILYMRRNGISTIKTISFNPSFKDYLFFIYLNKKQNSREAIKFYNNQSKTNINNAIKKINQITKQIIKSNHLNTFEKLITDHEIIIADILKTRPIQETHFKDYTSGAIKSLGAWGGDFILATGNKKNMEYFYQKGYQTIIAYNDLIR